MLIIYNVYTYIGFFFKYLIKAKEVSKEMEKYVLYYYIKYFLFQLNKI